MISWSYNDPNPGDSVSDISIKLSAGNTDTFDTVISSGLVPGTTSLNWDTREVKNGNGYRLGVFVTDKRGLVGNDVSGLFDINNANEPPSIKFKQPLGGEFLSGSISPGWILNDPNKTDSHAIYLFISSDSGVNFSLIAEIPGSSTYYAINTENYTNGTNYRLKITATDSGGLSDSDETSNLKIINNNLPPNKFNLLAPVNEALLPRFKITLSWENNGDPNPSDTVKYTIVYSIYPNFSPYVSIDGIYSTNYIFNPKELNTNTAYWWKVIASDMFGRQRQSEQIFTFRTLNESFSSSPDGSVSVEAISGLPENSFISIGDISGEDLDSVYKAGINNSGDRLLRVLASLFYKISVFDADNNPVSGSGIMLRITFRYKAENLGLSSVPAENFKVAYLDMKNNRWALPEGKQSNANGSIVIETDKSGIFTLAAANTPAKLISGLNIFPNPFPAGKQGAKIRYILRNDSEVKIDIYTLLGDIVQSWKYPAGAELKSKGQPEGYTNEQEWTGKNSQGEIVSNGMYICVITAKTGGESQKETKYIAVIK